MPNREKFSQIYAVSFILALRQGFKRGAGCRNVFFGVVKLERCLLAVPGGTEGTNPVNASVCLFYLSVCLMRALPSASGVSFRSTRHAFCERCQGLALVQAVVQFQSCIHVHIYAVCCMCGCACKKRQNNTIFSGLYCFRVHCAKLEKNNNSDNKLDLVIRNASIVILVCW